ncbi:MAG: four helix bundle protein [Opitutales bacterium]
MTTWNSFEDLECWQEARKVNQEIYRLTDLAPAKNDWALKDQLRRATISIMSNIAEGFGRESSKDFLKFLIYARGSAREVQSQLYTLQDIHGFEETDLEAARCHLLSSVRLINGLIRHLKL